MWRDKVRILHYFVVNVNHLASNSCLVTESYSPPPPAAPDALAEPPCTEPETEPPPADIPPEELPPLVVVV